MDSGRLERIHNILLASVVIAGAFPFRLIDDQLYVDGGVTGNDLRRAVNAEGQPTGRIAEDLPEPIGPRRSPEFGKAEKFNCVFF